MVVWLSVCICQLCGLVDKLSRIVYIELVRMCWFVIFLSINMTIVMDVVSVCNWQLCVLVDKISQMV